MTLVESKPIELREPALLRRQAYVDGRWVDTDSGATFAVTDPATGETIAEVPRIGGAETRRAIEAASRAYPSWRALTAKDRAAVMRRWADGVFNVVTGDAEDAPTIGRELTGNARVRKIGFTGSTEVGKLLMRQCADQVKKVSLELGGNAPFLVFDDADLDAAVDGAVLCKYRNSGQTCISANRILVQDRVYDEFVTRFTESVKAFVNTRPVREPVSRRMGPSCPPAAPHRSRPLR